MRGKCCIINIFCLLLLAVSVMPCTAAELGSVAVLLSADEEAYVAPVASFKAEIGLPVQVYNLHGDIRRARALRRQVLADKPSLIFALGAKAAVAAKLWTSKQQDIPVLFAMVINWRKYKLLEGQSNMSGIASEMSPGTQFANMALIAPDIKRVGVIYSREHSENIVAEARNAAAILGLELQAEHIERSSELQRAFKKLASRVDAYWMLNDPLVFTMENIDWLENRCVQELLVCMGQSENLGKIGIVLAVNPDQNNIGSQAASMAISILKNDQSPSRIGVMPPIATDILVNLKAARSIGFEISQAALNMATSVIE